MRVFWKVCVVMISVVLICVPHWTLAQTLQAGIAEWPPYQMYDGTDVTGIVIDILQEVSVRTGYTVVYHQLPPKRVFEYFKDTIITLEPASNPAWREAYNDISRYTISYMQATNVVLMKKGSGDPGHESQRFSRESAGMYVGL